MPIAGILVLAVLLLVVLVAVLVFAWTRRSKTTRPIRHVTTADGIRGVIQI